MAYTTKYYSNIYDLSGNTFQVNLKYKNYTGSSSQIQYYSIDPLTLTYYGGRDQIDLSVHGSELSFSFYVQSGQSYTDLLESNYQDWQIEVKKNGSVWWVGWLQPENLTTQIVSKSYFISLSAVDGLGNLANMDYPYVAHFPSGTTKMLTLIKNCLSQTGIALDIKSQVNIYEQHLSGTTLFDHLITNEKRFVGFDSGKVTYMNCYDALTAMLNSFNACLIQSEGYYKIFQKNEISSNQTTYNWNTLTGTTTTFTRQLSLNPFVKIDSDEISKIPPFKTCDLTFNQLDAGRLLPDNNINGFFKTNISGWDSEQSPNDYFTVDWDSGSTSLRAYQTFTNKHFQRDSAVVGTAPFNLNVSTGSTITVTLMATLKYISFTGGSVSSSFYPTLRIELRKVSSPSDVTVSFIDRPYPFASGTSVNYIVNLAYNATAQHYLRIWMLPNPNVFCQSIITEYDNITVFKNSNASIAYNLLYESTVNGSTALTTDSQTQSFGDGTSINQVGSLMYAPSALTSSWFDYGYKMQFDNNSFTQGFITPWTQEGSNSNIGWQYFGGLSNDVEAKNFNVGSSDSKYLMQSSFAAGNYTIKAAVKNLNGTGSPLINGYFKIIGRSLLTGNYTALASTNIPTGSSYNNYTLSFFLPEDSELGFQVGRFGTGNNLEMWVADCTITAMNLVAKKTLQELNLYNKLARSNKYRNYLRISIKDNSSISFNNVLQINGKLYDIVAMTNNIQGCWQDLELVENLQNTIAITTSKTIVTSS